MERTEHHVRRHGKRNQSQKTFFGFAALLFACVVCTGHVDSRAGEFQSVPVYAEAAKGLPAFFEKCKKSEPMLIAFLRQMPKGADLHNHASGAFTTEVYIDEAIAQNYYFNRDTQGFTKEEPKNGFRARAMVTDFSLYGEAVSALTMGNAAGVSGESGHDHFFLAFRRFPPLSGDAQKKAFKELFIHNTNQRVAYMETMATPPIVSMGPAKAADNIDSLDGVTEGASDEIDMMKAAWAAAEKEMQTENVQLDKSGPETAPEWESVLPKISYIASVSRDKYPAYDASRPFNATSYGNYFEGEVRARFEKMKRGEYAAMTLLSPEDAWISRTQFDLQMSIVNKVWTEYQKAGFVANMNLHGGELTPEYASLQDMSNRISKTISLGHCNRIGHGVSVAWEKDLVPLLKKMKGKVAVEICLVSNDGILNIAEGAKHPFLLYWQAGIPVVLATDDEGISRSNMTLQYVRAAQWFNLSYGQLKWLALWSLEHSFLRGDSLFNNGDMNARKAKMPSNSQKAELQNKVYNQFHRFEQDMVEYMKLWPGM